MAMHSVMHGLPSPGPSPTSAQPTESGIVRAGPLWLFVATPSSCDSSSSSICSFSGSGSDGTTGHWQRVVCTLRVNGYFSQADAETGVLGDLISMRDRVRRDVRLVNDSVLGRRHCFAVSGPLGVTFYAADNRATRLTWCTLLKQAAAEEMESRVTDLIASLNLQESYVANELPDSGYALQQRAISDGNPPRSALPGGSLISLARARAGSALDADRFRVEKRLHIRVNEARRVPLEDRSCWIAIEVGGELIARTSCVDASDLTWREEFVVNDIPRKDETVQLAVYSRSKGDKNTRIGIVRIPLKKLPRMQQHDDWYPIERDTLNLTLVGLTVPTLGEVGVRVRYEELVVLPAVAYEELGKLVMDEEPMLAMALGTATRNLDWIAERLLLIHQANNRAIEWLQFLTTQEIAKTGDPNILFRGNSMATKAIDAYMKLVGWQYLDDTIGGALRYICANQVCCEMDASRIDGSVDVARNGEILTSHAQMIWNAIESSIEECPPELRKLFAHIQRQVMEKHGAGEKMTANVRYTCVSGLLFLRLFCPAVLSPRMFDLVPEHPEAGTQRTLTLLAKTLQCLANLVEFGAKETFMTPMNAFIRDNTDSFKRFVDKLAGVERSPEPSRDAPVSPPPTGRRQNRRRGLIFNKQRRPMSESSVSGVLAAHLQPSVPISLDDLSTQPALPYMIDPDRELAALAHYAHSNSDRLVMVVGELDGERAPKSTGDVDHNNPHSLHVRRCSPTALIRLINICQQIYLRVAKTKQLREE